MIKVTDLQYWMDPYLKSNLDSLIYNLPNDWDALIGISGDGMVRVGKSELAKQVGYYIGWRLHTQFTVDNIVFSGAELIDKAKRFPKNSVLVYDEARGELDTKKVLQEITIALMDFFNECGKYNHVVILVLPEFFDLPKGIAINRSEFLINVYRKKGTIEKDGEQLVKLERGFFEFYGRDAKKRLYVDGKKNYNSYQPYGKPYYDFYGEFRHFSPIDEEAYNLKKEQFLSRDRIKEGKDYALNVCLKVLCELLSLREAEAKLQQAGLHISDSQIRLRIAKLLEK